MLILTSRFMAYFPDPASSAGSEEILRFEQGVKMAGLELGNKAPFLFACETQQPDLSFHPEPPVVLDVFPGTAASRPHFSIDPARPDWPAWHLAADREAQFYNLMQLDADAFRLESDFLGLKPFYLARLAQGMVLASRITDLIQAFPDLAAPYDALGLLELMITGSPYANRTLHAKIKRAATGACFRWSPQEGMRITRERRFKSPAADPTIGMDTAIERSNNAIKSSLKERCGGVALPVALALTGGFDSRILGACAKESGVPFKAFTYGHSYHQEVVVAKLVGEALETRPEILPFPSNGLIERLPFHLETIEAQADLPVGVIANLLNIEGEMGMPLLNGFIVGEVVGGRLNKLQDNQFSDLDTLAEGIANRLGEHPTMELLCSTLKISQNTLRDEIRRELIEDIHPYQAMLVFDMENRQRRYIASHFQILGSRFHVIAPYYSRDVINTFLSLPKAMLDDRLVYRQLMATHYPEMAKIPHCEEALPILPNLNTQLRLFMRGLPRKILSNRLSRRILYRGDSDKIWSSAFGVTPQQEEFMMSRIKVLKSNSEDLLGLPDLSPLIQPGKRNRSDIHKLFMLFEYAAWLPKPKRAGHE